MKKKKRLLFLISRFLDGGIDTVLVEYLRNIPPEEYDVTLAIGIKMNELEVHLSRVPAYVKVEYLVASPTLTKWRRRKISSKLPFVTKVYDEAILNPIRNICRKRRLRRLVDSHDAVIDFDATFYSVLSSLKPKKSIGFYHFSIGENLKRSPRHTRRQMQGMRGYNHVVLLSDDMVEEGRRLFPELSDKFVRIYNGYDLIAMRRRGDAEKVVDMDTKYFLSVARLEESQKDISTLLKAYARFRTAVQDGAPRLVLIGKGRDMERLETVASDLGVREYVDFKGFKSDPAPWMRSAEALILSSKYEGFGLVLVEAMIQGTPVIATDCPTGPAEVLAGGEAGVLVPIADVDAMSDAMLSIYSQPEFRQKLASAASDRAKAFDIAHSITQLLELCR